MVSGDACRFDSAYCIERKEVRGMARQSLKMEIDGLHVAADDGTCER
jgi:hypothetical protein